MLRYVLFVLLILLVLPAAGATRLDLVTHHPAHVTGAVAFEMEGASVVSASKASRSAVAIENATGRVVVWTWRTVHTSLADDDGVNAYYPAGDATSKAFSLRGADVRVVPDGGPFSFVARMGEGGRARLVGDRDGVVAPALRGEVQPYARLDVPMPFVAADDVIWRSDPSWAYVGNFLPTTPPHVPDAPEGTIEIVGPIRFKLDEGTVVFVDADGRDVRVELGTFPEAPGVETRRRLVFEGEIGPSRMPHGDVAGLSAPASSWHVDGAASWVEATGEARSPDGDAPFERSNVLATGTFRLVPRPPRGIGETTYSAEGPMEVFIEGSPALVPPAARDGADAAEAALALGTVSFLVWRIGLVLYTRLATEDVLTHPRRRALWEMVTDRPGLRQRDLQKAMGIGWGAFTFHLRVLVTAGHLRIRREGLYTLVVPTVLTSSSRPPIGHPSARAVYDALPPDGAEVAVADLKGRVGFSRQRVDHHLRALEARGLARVSRDAQGHRRVARATPGDPAWRAEQVAAPTMGRPPRA